MAGFPLFSTILNGLYGVNEILNDSMNKKEYEPMLLVTLNLRIVDLTTNQTLSVEDSIFWVGVEGVLSGVTDTVEMNAPLEA